MPKPILVRYLNSPLGLGASYFALIPVFAFVYAFILPDEFYHSNLKIEPTYHEDIYKFEEKIRTSITAYLLDIEATQDHVINGVGVIRYHPERRFFNISIHVDKKDSSCPLPFYTYSDHEQDENCADEKIYWCDLRHYSDIANYFNRQGYALGCNSAKNVPIRNVDEDLLQYLDITIERYLLKRNYDVDLYSDLTLLSYSMDVTAQELEANQRKTDIIVLLRRYEMYIDGYQSIPSMNVYLRMTYFSIVTITTLGYGDISPVTNRARLLVGIETLLGILLVGLFLNAITRRPDKSTLEKS